MTKGRYTHIHIRRCARGFKERVEGRGADCSAGRRLTVRGFVLANNWNTCTGQLVYIGPLSRMHARMFIYCACIYWKRPAHFSLPQSELAQPRLWFLANSCCIHWQDFSIPPTESLRLRWKLAASIIFKINCNRCWLFSIA